MFLLAQNCLYKCPDCQRTYKHKCSLQAHRKYECGQDPQFSCPHCPFKAKTRSNLKAHIASKHFHILSK